MRRVGQHEVEGVAGVALHASHLLHVHDIGAVAAEEPEAGKLGLQLVHGEARGVQLAAHARVVHPVGTLDEVDVARVEQQCGVAGLRGDLAHAHLVGKAIVLLDVRLLHIGREQAPLFFPKRPPRQKKRLAQGLAHGDEHGAGLIALGDPRQHEGTGGSA